MIVRPGPALIGLGITLVLLSLIAFWSTAAALTVTGTVLLATAALCVREFLTLRRDIAAITVAREIPAVVGRGRAFVVALTLKSPAASAVRGNVREILPASAVPDVWIERFEIPARGQIRLERSFEVPLRGRYTFGPVWIRLTGPLRLLELQRAFPVESTLRVLPENFVQYAELHKESADELRLLDQIRHSRQQGAGTEFESLAEYREGDDPRRIDWRATARIRRPIVRRFQVERHRDLMILVDSGRLMGGSVGNGTKLDSAVDAALMLGRIALLSGDRCGLGIFEDRVLGYMPPQAGPRSVSILSNGLYDLQSDFRETDFGPMFATLQARQQKRALVVILSDLVDEQTSIRYRGSLARLARRHLVLFAALQTPLLRDLQHGRINSLLDGYRTAVAFRLLRERERAIRSLEHTGVHVLDVEPTELTVPLINQYIDLRQRNLV